MSHRDAAGRGRRRSRRHASDILPPTSPTTTTAIPFVDLAAHMESQLEDHQFNGIPAWRIARLRAALRAVEARGANERDDGLDITHRAARLRFARGRSHIFTSRSASKLKTTRKGRRFPIAKQVAIWRIILTHRPVHWRQGDVAPYGKLRLVHTLATKACRAAGLTAPRYRTIQMLWHRGVPPPAVLAALAQPIPSV